MNDMNSAIGGEEGWKSVTFLPEENGANKEEGDEEGGMFKKYW